MVQRLEPGSGFEFSLGGFCGGFFFAFHVFVLDGIEDVAAGLALDIFCVFIAGDDAHDGVFAGSKHGECGPAGPVGCDFAVPPARCQSGKSLRLA